MDSFSPTYKPTMDVDFTQSNVMVGEQRLRVGLWQASRGSCACACVCVCVCVCVFYNQVFLFSGTRAG